MATPDQPEETARPTSANGEGGESSVTARNEPSRAAAPIPDDAQKPHKRLMPKVRPVTAPPQLPRSSPSPRSEAEAAASLPPVGPAEPNAAGTIKRRIVPNRPVAGPRADEGGAAESGSEKSRSTPAAPPVAVEQPTEPTPSISARETTYMAASAEPVVPRAQPSEHRAPSEQRVPPEPRPEVAASNGASAASPAPAAPRDPEAPRPRRTVRAPRPSGPRIQPYLTGKQQVQGQHPGDRYVRVIRQRSDDFALAGPGHLIATDTGEDTRGPLGRAYGRLKRMVIGAPLATSMAAHERLSKTKALAVLSSDALSSVSYATEEILRVLLLSAGVAALGASLPVGAAIIALLLIVGFSYRQTIKAYPNGGGSYIVAKDNLGELPALTAGAALLVDYVLTVAVSIAAAIAALVSVFPWMNQHRVGVGIAFIVLVTLLNLRGIRESGTIFAVPTYLFLIGILLMIVVGFVRNALEGFSVQPVPPEAEEVAGAGALTAFVVLRAFSSGATALTGVEAISDGVPAFKPPEWKNARATLTIMITILAVMFGGITWLAHQYGTWPMPQDEQGYETVVYQIAKAVFVGWGPLPPLYIQFATMAILVLAANTAYSDFPRLSYFLARDKYMPNQFTFRGDRLAYSTGILTLGILAATVLAIFGGETERLIPLYALGVFTSFTLSQLGMVVRWQRRKEPGWQQGLVINAIGASATAVVAIIVTITKFTHGAWIVCLLIPLLIMAMRGIYRHYAQAATELAAQTPLHPDEIHHTVIVPIAGVSRVALQTLAYARSISDNVTAVHVTDDEDEIKEMQRAWTELGTDVPLVIIESPYRALVGPLLSYINEIDKQRPDDTLTVILPEYVARHWWEQLLHNQTALRIKAALLFKPGIVVTSVPYHLERPNAKGAPIRPPDVASTLRRRI